MVRKLIYKHWMIASSDDIPKTEKKMELVTLCLVFTAFPPLCLLLILSLILLKCYAGKSITDRRYPPVDGTVFHQLIYFNKLYDYQTESARDKPTFRLLNPSHSEIYTVDSRNVEHILKTRFENYSKGATNQDIVTDLFGNGIFAVDGEKWRQQRKLASFEFSTRNLREFSCSVFRTNAAKLAGIVSELADSGGVFDMQDLLMRCALDSIFKVGFGADLNCMDGSNVEATGFMKAFDEANALIYWRYVDPLWKLKKFLNVGCEKALRINIKLIDHFVHDLINSRRQLLAGQKDSREDILSRFLAASEKDPETMTDNYLRDIILNFMIAGKDSSANTLCWFFYMLCKHPLIQEKVIREIMDVTGTRGTAVGIRDFVESISESTLEKMHYLHAALTETLRLYPAVPIDGRCADIDDVLPDGYRLKKGDGVYYMAYAMGRMSSVWGEDAEEFRPERWIREGVFQPESPFKFVAFHGGPRICLGKDFAYRQIKISTMALLRFVRFKLAEERKSGRYKTMFTLHMDGGLHLRAIHRRPT